MSLTARLALIAGVVASATLVEPRLASLAPWAFLVCAGLLAALLRAGIDWSLLPPLVGVFAATVAVTGFNLGADTLSYVATAVSLVQDGDFEQANQLVAWGRSPAESGPAGMTVNAHPVGPAVLWAPALLIAHAYVKASGHYPQTFIAPPYLGAMVLTTMLVALSGALALVRFLASREGAAAAALGVSGVFFASPILFYVTLQPLMAHGFAFGLACWGIVAVARATETRATRDWLFAGLALGAVAACRFQALVLLALVPIVLGPSGAALLQVLPRVFAAFLLPLLPQACVFIKTFGTPLAIPQGPTFMHWSSPHWVDTLLSADRGLLNWHPLLGLGLVGLAWPAARLRRWAGGGLIVFALVTWTNGSVADFNGSDAFGARRFDIALPFLALGLARALAIAAPLIARRPLLLPALLLVLPFLSNALLMADYGKVFIASAPVDDVMASRGRWMRRAADQTIGRLGDRARFRVYDAFVGLYTYRNFHGGGEFDPATLESRFLGPGWSEVKAWDDETLFRYVLFPEACVTIPLEEPFDLRGFVEARSPARIQDQRITLLLNGRAVVEQALPSEWTQVAFKAPAALWKAGENTFCVRLAKKRPGDEGDDIAYAAAISRIQLP